MGLKQALLGTGSCVRPCSRSFYENNLGRLELRPLDNFAKTECATGEHMPYFGYIQVGVKPNGVPSDHVQSSILLVLPDTECNTNLPVLLYTNVLTEFLANCRETISENFLQNAALFTPWYLAFRCSTVRQRQLKRNKKQACSDQMCRVN